MIKLARAIVLIACLGAILAVPMPASASLAVHRHSIFRIASHATAAPGAQLWASRYSGSVKGQDEPFSVAVSPDGATVYVTGISTGINTGSDYATIAYNAATGAKLWVSRYNGQANSEDDTFSVAVSPDGQTLYVTGGSTNIPPTNTGIYRDYATVAYSSATGVPVWTSLYNGPANGDDVATSMAVSPATGTVFVTGQSDGTTTGPDYATVAYQG